jgi:hypothetical protein
MPLRRSQRSLPALGGRSVPVRPFPVQPGSFRVQERHLVAFACRSGPEIATKCTLSTRKALIPTGKPAVLASLGRSETPRASDFAQKAKLYVARSARSVNAATDVGRLLAGPPHPRLLRGYPATERPGRPGVATRPSALTGRPRSPRGPGYRQANPRGRRGPTYPGQLPRRPDDRRSLRRLPGPPDDGVSPARQTGPDRRRGARRRRSRARRRHRGRPDCSRRTRRRWPRPGWLPPGWLPPGCLR